MKRTPVPGEEHLASNPTPADYWVHRRTMVWLAVCSGLFWFPVGVVFCPALLELAPAFYSLVTMMVAAYMTSSVLDDKWKKEKT